MKAQIRNKRVLVITQIDNTDFCLSYQSGRSEAYPKNTRKMNIDTLKILSPKKGLKDGFERLYENA